MDSIENYIFLQMGFLIQNKNVLKKLRVFSKQLKALFLTEISKSINRIKL